MFCSLTYSRIQFIQRMIPPLSMNYKAKPNRFSLLYKKSGHLSTSNLLDNLQIIRVANKIF